MSKQRHTIIPASYLLLIKNDHVLLLRRCNTGYEDGNYSLIAGHVDKGESFTVAMAREAYEEAGITIAPEQLDIAHIMHRKSTFHAEERVDIFMMAKEWKGEVENKEPQKCDDLHWFPIDRLPSNTIPYVKRAIDDTRKGIIYSEYGW